MFGLEYDELAVAAGTFVLVARVLYALAGVVRAWAVDRFVVRVSMPATMVTGLALATVAVGLVSLAGVGGQKGIQQVVYLMSAFAGLFFGFLFDMALGHWQYRLYRRLAARNLPLYREQLTAPDAEVRKHAADRLAFIGPYARPALPDLLAALKDESADVRVEVIEAVLAAADPPAEDDADTPKAARAALSDPDPRVRACAAALLVRFRAAPPEEVLPVLCDGVVRTEDGCAFYAAVALEKLGPAAAPAIPALREAVLERTPENFVGVNALAAVGPAAIPVLIEVLERGGSYYKSVAAKALGDMGEPARVALPALRKLALKTDDVAHHAAKAAIKKLGGDIA
jgi:HEAT repeat protein